MISIYIVYVYIDAYVGARVRVQKRARIAEGDSTAE